jgi:hypothetical protein
MGVLDLWFAGSAAIPPSVTLSCAVRAAHNYLFFFALAAVS